MIKNKIYLSILIFIIGILISLPLVKVPISTSARGIVRSSQENTPITVMVGGRVIKNRLENNNQDIKKGDTLLVITAEQLHTQKQLQQSQSSDYQAQLSDLNKITKGIFAGLQTGQYQREVSAMKERIAQVQTELSLSKKDLDRATLLHNQGVLPRADYDKEYYRHKGLQNQIGNIREQQIAQWQAQKRETERQIRQLDSEIQRINQEQKNYVVIAHSSGKLINYIGIQTGSFLTQGQVLGEISPEQNLTIECTVLPKDIGFIHKGQEVKYQIDTYNYNQWGLLMGKVIDIDQNITINSQTGESYFKVRCLMDNNYLQLKNGYKGNINKGMTLTTRFHLTDRTLWQLLFDRVDNWFNPNFK